MHYTYRYVTHLYIYICRWCMCKTTNFRYDDDDDAAVRWPSLVMWSPKRGRWFQPIWEIWTRWVMDSNAWDFAKVCLRKSMYGANKGLYTMFQRSCRVLCISLQTMWNTHTLDVLVHEHAIGRIHSSIEEAFRSLRQIVCAYVLECLCVCVDCVVYRERDARIQNLSAPEYVCVCLCGGCLIRVFFTLALWSLFLIVCWVYRSFIPQICL